MAARTPNRISDADFDADASRREAQRVVAENQAAAERFARTGQVQTPDAAIAALDAALTASLGEVA